MLITFDDGQLSVLEYALPLLEKYDMCAVAAVVGKYCDREETLEYRSPEYSYMTWAEVGELGGLGKVRDRLAYAGHARGELPEARLYAEGH